MKKLIGGVFGFSFVASLILAFTQKFDGFLPHHQTEFDLAFRHLNSKVLYVNVAFTLIFLAMFVLSRRAFMRRVPTKIILALYLMFLSATAGAWYTMARYLEDGTGFSPIEFLDGPPKAAEE